MVGPQCQARIGMTACLSRVAFLQIENREQLLHRGMRGMRRIGLLAQHPGALAMSGVGVTDRQAQDFLDRDCRRCHAPWYWKCRDLHVPKLGREGELNRCFRGKTLANAKFAAKRVDYYKTLTMGVNGRVRQASAPCPLVVSLGQSHATHLVFPRANKSGVNSYRHLRLEPR